MKTITVTFNATMAQLYQVLSYYRETEGINVTVYNVRKTINGFVKCTTAYNNESLLIAMMTNGGYPIVDKESIENYN